MRGRINVRPYPPSFRTFSQIRNGGQDPADVSFPSSIPQFSPANGRLRTSTDDVQNGQAATFRPGRIADAAPMFHQPQSDRFGLVKNTPEATVCTVRRRDRMCLGPHPTASSRGKGGGACRQRQVRRVSAIAVLEFCTVRKKVNCAGLIQGSSDPKAQLGKAVSPVSTHANRWSRSPAAPSGPHDFPPVSTPSARHSSAVCECDTQGGRKPSYPSEN
jgi:hypothetical protein